MLRAYHWWKSTEGAMGHEILPATSPAHRRVQNASSPISPFKKAGFQVREEPDLGWRALIHRHQFLLLMLALLTFLCTVYLYFAITLGTGCAGLTGTQKAVCKLSNAKPKRTASRALLQYPVDSDANKISKHTKEILHLLKQKGKETISSQSTSHADILVFTQSLVNSKPQIFLGKHSTFADSTTSLTHGFNLILCDKCDVAWFANDGQHISEITRLLQPGGYLFATAPWGLDTTVWNLQFSDFMQRSNLSSIVSYNGLQIWRNLDTCKGMNHFASFAGQKVLPRRNFVQSSFTMTIFHDWCEPPSQPTIFDYIYISGFSSLRCGVLEVLSNVNRLLSQGGAFIIQDSPGFIHLVQDLAPSLGWQVVRSESEEDTATLTQIHVKDESAAFMAVIPLT